MKTSALTQYIKIASIFIFISLYHETRVLAQKLTIPVETQNNALVLQVNDGKDLSVQYYGRKLTSAKEYSSIKQIIWQGDQYRLSDPVSNSVASIMFVDSSKTTGVVFNYLVNYRYGTGSKLPILLKGLDAAKKYKLREINLYPGTGSDVQADKVYTGDFLMNIGINPVVNSKRTSCSAEIRRVSIISCRVKHLMKQLKWRFPRLDPNKVFYQLGQFHRLFLSRYAINNSFSLLPHPE